VCDRFTDATRAYQGSGRGVDAAWIDSLAASIHGDLQPDCTLLLDLPPAVGLTRARQRSGLAADRFEAETEAFFARVRAGYLELARREPQRVRIIDAALELEQVKAQVVRELERLI
jgi:dTMP kinase